MSKVTAHMMGKILDKEFKTKAFSNCRSLDKILETLIDNTEDFRTPFDISETYLIEESLPLYGARNFKKNSDLHNSLSDIPDEVALVVDSVLSSIASLHFIAIKPAHKVKTVLTKWLSVMESYDLLVRPFGSSGDYVIITKLTAFKKEKI